MFNVRTLQAALTFILFLAIASPARPATCDAEPFVQTAGQAMLRAARSRSASALAGVVNRYGDVRGLAYFALGAHRNKLPKAKDAEYIALTRDFVGRFLAKYASKFTASSLIVTSCTGDDKSMTVTAKLSSGQKIILRLYKTRNGYVARDMNIASIWLGQQMRTTFTGVMNRNGGNINSLMAFLRR
jgi:phospholipid transport system substrate-binding protein